MIAYEERKYRGLDSTQKQKMLEELQNASAVVTTGTCEYGCISSAVDKGVIQSIGPGVWGYEGDSLAVYVNGVPYPSVAIVELNC